MFLLKKKKNVNPEGENATDQASSVKGFRNLSIFVCPNNIDKTRTNTNAKLFHTKQAKTSFVLYLFVEI